MSISTNVETRKLVLRINCKEKVKKKIINVRLKNKEYVTVV